MKPAKKLRHIETKHPSLKDKPLEFFERKKCERKRQKQLLKATTSSNVSALRASILAANHIVKAQQPFTVGEETIPPAASDISHELLGEAAVKKVSQVLLVTHVITGQIDGVAKDTEAQLSQRIDELPRYAIQVDVCTVFDNKAIVHVFVQHTFQDNVHEDMLCGFQLPTNTTAAELFRSLNDYLAEKLNWSFCVGVGGRSGCYDWTASWFHYSAQRGHI